MAAKQSKKNAHQGHVTEEVMPPPPPIDWTKPVRTRAMRMPVRVLCTDAKGDYPVVVLVRLPDGTDEVQNLTKDGLLSLSGGRPYAENYAEVKWYQKVEAHIPPGQLGNEQELGPGWSLLLNVTVNHTAGVITHVELAT